MAQDFGHNGLTVGEVVNVKDDPTQTGRVKVRWHLGAVSQNQLQEKDLPWTQCMFPSTNPCNNNTGGPHHGLQVGSKVYGMPLGGDGQDFLIVGTVARAGTGKPDQEANYDADVPHPGKVQNNNGKQQPKYGDKNSVVSQQSIWQFGQQQGGKGQTSTLYDKITDSIGMIASITEQPAGQGGAGGVDALLANLISSGNKSGSCQPGPNVLQQLEGKIKGVPFALLTPGMSNLVSSGNMLNGLMGLAGGLGGIGNLAGIGNIGQLISQVTSTVKNIENMSPAQIVQIAASQLSSSDLSQELGPINSLAASLFGV